MKKIQVNYSDIKELLESVPPGLKIPLNNGTDVLMNSDQIIDEIIKKSDIGKKYYIQLAKVALNRKIKKIKDKNGI